LARLTQLIAFPGDREDALTEIGRNPEASLRETFHTGTQYQ
jgi:hypothetical protein